MAKKTYRTYYLKSLAIHAKDENDKRIDIIFRGGIQVDSTAKFTTADPKIQDMLEKSSSFGKTYYLESVAEPQIIAPAKPAKVEKAAEEAPLSDVKDIKRFRNLVEMKNALRELGVDVKDEWNYTATKAAAAKEGYDFQIKK